MKCRLSKSGEKEEMFYFCPRKLRSWKIQQTKGEIDVCTVC